MKINLPEELISLAWVRSSSFVWEVKLMVSMGASSMLTSSFCCSGVVEPFSRSVGSLSMAMVGSDMVRVFALQEYRALA